MDDGIQIDEMRLADMSWAIDGAAREGWNPGWGDPVAFRAADPGGFLIARVHGRAVGCISAVRYSETFGFLGLYIVDPDLRGRGIGTRLWDAALLALEDRVVGLDGVVAMQHAYQRSGFVLAHRNVRYEGIVPAGLALPPEVTELAPSGITEVLAYDGQCFGAERATFLEAWVAQPGVRAVVTRSDDAVTGFAVVRPCRRGAKVGPLFADDPQTADALFAAACAALPVGSVRILDVPEPNALAEKLARRANMAPAFETARMYRGGNPHLPIERIFGITSFELG